MIAFICRQTDTGAAYSVGGPVNIDYKTFINVDEMEKWLREPKSDDHRFKYIRRECIGIKLL